MEAQAKKVGNSSHFYLGIAKDCCGNNTMNELEEHYWFDFKVSGV